MAGLKARFGVGWRPQATAVLTRFFGGRSIAMRLPRGHRRGVIGGGADREMTARRLIEDDKNLTPPHEHRVKTQSACSNAKCGLNPPAAHTR